MIQANVNICVSLAVYDDLIKWMWDNLLLLAIAKQEGASEIRSW